MKYKQQQMKSQTKRWKDDLDRIAQMSHTHADMTLKKTNSLSTYKFMIHIRYMYKVLLQLQLD